MKIKMERIFSNFYGCLSQKRTTTARRRCWDEEDIYPRQMDPFAVDGELKIALAKAVRRLTDRTQVLTSPRNEHVRKRITHAGEVTALAVFMSDVMGLNTNLCRAIALGHDIGHPPFGHDGEAFLNQVGHGKVFRHEIFGVVIAQHIERCGHGLNLTLETLSGIARDAWPAGDRRNSAMSEETKTVMWADRIAYLTGDFNDMQRIGYPVGQELTRLMSSLGSNQRERVYTLISALVAESGEAGAVSFDTSEEAQKFRKIRELMYEHYPVINASNSLEILERIYGFVAKTFKDLDPVPLIALMTDQDALFLAGQPILDYPKLAETTVMELVPQLRKKPVLWYELDLDW